MFGLCRLPVLLQLCGAVEQTADLVLFGNILGLTPMSLDKICLPLLPAQWTSHVDAMKVGHSLLRTMDETCVGGGGSNAFGLPDIFLAQQIAQGRSKLL
jgi:hypothetical protein